MQDTPTPEMEADFEKADMILSDALERFQAEGVNAYVYGSALLEIGVAALVKVGALLYRVRTGAYLGQDFGRVMKIAENEITLREIAQDAAGEWIERPAALQLQEDTSK